MLYRLTMCVACVLLAPVVAFGEEAASQTISLAGGAMVADAPSGWQTVAPKIRMIEHEYAITAPEGSQAEPGRLTLMAAGGSVQQNVSRWIGQFQGTEGGADRSAAKTEQTEVNGMPTTLVDIEGTFLQSRGGPFGPKTPKPGYRMLGAIIETGAGQGYFFKLVGPAETLEPAEAGFRALVESVRKK